MNSRPSNALPTIQDGNGNASTRSRSRNHRSPRNSPHRSTCRNQRLGSLARSQCLGTVSRTLCTRRQRARMATRTSRWSTPAADRPRHSTRCSCQTNSRSSSRGRSPPNNKRSSIRRTRRSHVCSCSCRHCSLVPPDSSARFAPASSSRAPLRASAGRSPAAHDTLSPSPGADAGHGCRRRWPSCRATSPAGAAPVRRIC
mmetsp:Transcript_68051/g.181154  ORF Transcript_68051/g.181154 Transcript_68051/m.181154 type:complete len:200 (+) Transcript_68051:129-728(+)